MRVGNMALFAGDRQNGAKRATATIFDDIAQGVSTRGFANQAIGYWLVARLQCFHYFDCTVDRRTFFISGD